MKSIVNEDYLIRFGVFDDKLGNLQVFWSYPI